MDKYIGRLLDNRYEILEIIGTGGMAVVYKARCHRLNRLVALKILKDDYSQDNEFRRRFHAESQAVAMLNHHNIVSVYDVSTEGDADYIVMELVDGITLKQYVESRGGYLNWKEALHFALQIGRALEHAHNQGIVHRDIKPHNVMILKNGSAKVTDFGIARVMSSQNTLTREALGSVHYISPEQAKGGRVDSRSDIYSLGVVMYEMLTGRPPYNGESPVAIALQHISGGAPMPSTLNPNIPAGLEQIIMRAMAVDPDKRHTTITSMLYDMEEFRQNPGILFPYGAVPDPGPELLPPPGPEEPRTAAAQQPRTQGAQKPGSVPGSGAKVTLPRSSQKPAHTGAGQRAQQSHNQREQSNRNMMIAVISCAAVLLLAIIILIATVIRGRGNDDPILVEVPDFVGQVYERLDPRDYPRLQLVDKTYVFNDQYPMGEIIEQNPHAEALVEEGTKIEFVVSLGVQTDEMPDLLKKSKENAKALLDELTDLSLTVMFDEEYSIDVEAGVISRTEPVAGELLTKGQTVILWVSKGPMSAVLADYSGKTKTEVEAAFNILAEGGVTLELKFTEEASEEIEAGKVIRTEPGKGAIMFAGQTVTVVMSRGSDVVLTKVPQVVGMDISKASSILKDNNLKCEYESVESDAPKDEVLTQDVEKGTMVPEGTVIKLTISLGPQETEPTDPPPVSKTVILKLPENITVPYTIQVYCGDTALTDEYEVQPGVTEVPMSLNGNGVVYYDFYVNGSRVDSFRVDFSAEGEEVITLTFTVAP